MNELMKLTNFKRKYIYCIQYSEDYGDGENKYIKMKASY